MTLVLAARLALGGALLVGALLVGSAGAPADEPGTSPDQAYAWNCDGTSWSYRAAPLPNGTVGISYASVPPGAPQNPRLYRWSDPLSLGGRVTSPDDLSMTCLAGRVWVFARFSTPVDGTAQLYERHAYPEDAANDVGNGWEDWYHWR